MVGMPPNENPQPVQPPEHAHNSRLGLFIAAAIASLVVLIAVGYGTYALDMESFIEEEDSTLNISETEQNVAVEQSVAPVEGLTPSSATESDLNPFSDDYKNPFQ